MLLGAIVNGIDSLISLSSVPLLVSRNATDFWALIVYPATLPNCCMSLAILGWRLLGFLCRVSCHRRRGRVWLLCQLEWLYFFLLSDCWGRTSSTMLNSCGESGIPVLFLILGERLPVLPHWEWYLLWAFRRWLLRCWGMFPLSLHSEEFWSEMDADFVKCFLCI